MALTKLSTTMIEDSAITAAKIADGTVVAAEIADDAITAEKIADDAITAAKIADNAVTTAKINADAVTAAKVADDVINSEHLVDGGVDNAHLATGIASSKLTGALPAISGASLTNLPPAPRKNLIINGGMTVSQRGTSETGVTSTGFKKAPDRYKIMKDNCGTWTVSQSTDSPNGFSNSYKFDCTTAQASLPTDAYLWLMQSIEAQDLQLLNWGSSNAESITLSFWVKSNKTGTYIVELQHDEVPSDYRYASLQYTISSANTWEQKTLTFTGNTHHAINNDNGSGLEIHWYLAVGTDQTSGSYTAGTFRSSNGSANRCPGHNVNLADSTSNEWLLTGVKLEVGTSATDFEHRSYGEELALCQRYFTRVTQGILHLRLAMGENVNTTRNDPIFTFHPSLRSTPSLSVNTVGDFLIYAANTTYTATSITPDLMGPKSCNLKVTTNGTMTAGGAGQFVVNSTGATLDFSAEL